MLAANGTRLLWRHIAAGTLIGTLIAIGIVGATVYGLRDKFVGEGQHSAVRVALEARDALTHPEPGALRRVVLGGMSIKAASRVSISDADGQLLISQERDIQPPVATQEPLAAILGEAFAYRLPKQFNAPIYPSFIARPGQFLDIGGGPVGWATVILSPAEFARQNLPHLTPILASAAGACGFIVLVSVFLGLRRRRTLVAIHAALERMRDGDLQARVGVRRWGTLGRLAAAVDATAKAHYDAKLELEEKVERTTSELRQTLEAVEIQNVELDLARKRALEASKVKSEFLANMSHEIRTPINGILGFADLLAHSPLDEEQRDYVNTIKDSCANLLTIVNDILDFSKIEAGKLAIDSVAFDLRDSVEEVLSLLAPTAYGKALELVHLIYTDVPLKLYGDPIRIRQVLTNLVHNAIKFTPSGRVVVRIMLEDETDTEALLRVTVTDTGIGLSKEDQAKLFTAFGQADTSITRRFGGAGLGLIISRKLVEQMGGSIGFESEPGQGSTFWFTLRCLRQRIPQQASEDRREQPLAGKRVLIYDEDGLSRLALKHIIETWNMRVTEVDDRHRFISLAGAQSRWDLIVVGLNRADLNARTFHGLMPRLRHITIPILVLASTVDRNELRSILQQGARAALPKALRRQTLYREIFRLIDDGASGGMARPPATGRTEPPIKRDTQGGDITVLVVDDNQINRKLMSTILNLHGARVLEAEDGKAAVDIALSEQVDLIFMDIHMPTMSGETAAQMIRSQAGARRVPRIVALTANAMPGERDRLLRAGMDDCLIKPISEEQVAEILDNLRTGKKNKTTVPKPASGTASATRTVPMPPPRSQPRSDMLDELRQMLVAELPTHKRAIQQAYRSNRLTELKDRVHTLHGAASVCRQQSLRTACADLETALARDDVVAVPAGVTRVLKEIDALLAGEPYSNSAAPAG